ncbi:L-threonylcarbamoyladenylate synthase [Parvularcula dongshanensis]|uniref:Threonylcarbamoyl-AMP synthase n=1 Tax=Parvularcula dongshanensis TaxID=1173995 RepID=A0A840I3Z2_9PROT|nr:L-threonylcarbamoyladenylate synthase [Parvularcula dongshanensis]MBB4659716.1 L-threonylcarbamoyladenylate synthase [Parvularcula dongshanensis]
MSRIWQANDEGIERAARRLATGGLVGVPTETVYGLAADASDGEAVASVFTAKGRPRFNPLIVHVADPAAAEALVDTSPEARRVMSAFWPGPLTLVLPTKAAAPIASLASAGLPSLAIRCPAHEVARALLARFGRPFVAPSANPSGGVSPTTARHVAEGLPDVPVLDGGPCEVGVESTIVGLAGKRPTLLRPGSVLAADVEAVLGMPLAQPSGGVEAPGMMRSHYAPASAVRLNARSLGRGEVLLGFGGTAGAAFDLSPTGDLREAAANLFAALRRLDGLAPVIAVAPIPHTGLGVAINDRLARAAAPRD